MNPFHYARASDAPSAVALLSRRLARLSPAQIRAIKGAVDATLGVDLKAGMEQEWRFLGLVYPAPEELTDRVRRVREGACRPGSRRWTSKGRSTSTADRQPRRAISARVGPVKSGEVR
jgi:hypothetical protein